MVRPFGQLISGLDANVVVMPSGVVFEMRPGDWQFVLYTFPSASTATPTGAAMPAVAYVVTVPSGVIFEIRLPPMFDWKRLPSASNALPDAPTNPVAKTETSPSGVTR